MLKCGVSESNGSSALAFVINDSIAQLVRGKENSALVRRCHHDRSQTPTLLHGEASVASGFGYEGFEVGGHGYGESALDFS